jgi:hypothetical protein
MKMKKTIFALAVSVCLTLLPGCQFGGEVLPEGLPKLVPASIQLVQDDAPLAGATVSLIDTAGSQQWYPGGLSNDSGTIVLYTNGRYKGAPEGKYKVVVTKTETDPSKLGPAPSETDPKYGEYMEKSANEKRDTYTLIDKKFGDAKTTTLEVEIKKGSSEVPKLDVGKKVKIKIS